MGDSGSGYQFGTGIGEEEVARLEAKGAAIAPATRMIFAEAGIRPGMRVLDLGCGAGDVTFVAADLVGPDGCVVGMDRSADALARARLRAGHRGLTQVQFVEATSTTRRRAGRSTRSSSGWPCGRFRTRPRCCGGRRPCCALAAWSCR